MALFRAPALVARRRIECLIVDDGSIFPPDGFVALL